MPSQTSLRRKTILQNRSSGGSGESHGAFGSAGTAEGVGATGAAATGTTQAGTAHRSSTGFAHGEVGTGTAAGGFKTQGYVYGRGGRIDAQAKDYMQRKPGKALLFAGAVGFALASFIRPAGAVTPATPDSDDAHR